jgi:hypothetical protein
MRRGRAGRAARTMIEQIELTYELHLLPRGRINLRRWRFELWHGSQLLAAGWRVSAEHAERALGAHAVRYAHRLHGLYPLHPERASVLERRWRERPIAVQSGDLRVLLRPRRLTTAA